MAKTAEDRVEEASGQVVHEPEELAAAHQAAAHVGSASRRVVWNILVGSIGGFVFGWSNNVIGTTLGQTTFANYFRLSTTANVQELTGVMVSMYHIGALFGLVAQSYVSDRWGRKRGILFTSIIVIIGQTLSGASASNHGMFIFARFVTGFGGWPSAQAALIYCSEMAVAEVRGFLAGIVGFIIGLGYAVTSWVGCGFYFTTLAATWRIPLLLGIAFPLIWIALLPTIDETPRWLATQGRYDEVTRILRRIHANPQDPTHAYADYEAAQLQAQAEMDKTLDSSWKILFTTPGNRKRVACVVLAASGQMCSGVAAILAFGPQLYAGLGYDTGDQLFFSAGFNTISPLESIIMMYLCDKIGRKVMIATCPLGSAVCLFIYSGLVAVYADSDNQAGKAAAVAMLFIYFAAYLFIEVAIFVFIGEVFPTRLRAKGSTIGIGTIALHSIWTTMATPVGLEGIGYKFIFVFGALSVVFGGLIIWLFPETKQVPLEEIARLFGEENEIGVVTSGAFKTRVRGGDQFDQSGFQMKEKAPANSEL